MPFEGAILLNWWNPVLITVKRLSRRHERANHHYGARRTMSEICNSYFVSKFGAVGHIPDKFCDYNHRESRRRVAVCADLCALVHQQTERTNSDTVRHIL